MTSPQELLDANTESAVAADLARRAVEPKVFDIIEDRLTGVVVNGQLHKFDLDDYLDNPRQATGLTYLTDPDSFVEYVNRHISQTATTIWSDIDKDSLTAVLDDHANNDEDGVAGLAGYGAHRSTLKLKLSPDWKHWMKLNNQMVGQVEFAEHIEDGSENITSPEPAAMLELAQSFQANTKVDFESSDRLQSGEVKLTYKETVTAKAGHTGSIDIPTMITLRLQVFEGGSTYELKARFKYRIVNGQLSLGYRLIRPDVAKQLAFDDIRATVSEGTGLPILAGTPRSSS